MYSRLVFGLILLLPACRALDTATPDRPATGQQAVQPSAPKPTRYDDLLRYVPADMESVLVFDLTRKDWPNKIIDCYTDTVRRGVLAGRKFLFPSREEYGFEGIFLLEGPKTLWPAHMAESEYVFSYATFDIHRTKDKQPLFFAQVTPEQTLYATTEAMMREAVKARGPGGSVLAARMGWPDGVPWQSSLVLLRRPDPNIPDEETKEDRRTALWVTQDSLGGEEPPRFRITHLAMHASNPARLEFAVRVKLRDSIKANQLPKRPILNCEPWWGFEQMGASVENGIVLMKGNLRTMLEGKDPLVTPLLMFTMLGVTLVI